MRTRRAPAYGGRWAPRSATACRRRSSPDAGKPPPAREFLELRSDNRTYAVWPVLVEDLGFMNLYGMDVTAERAIVKFPDQNPNPVLRIDWDGRLVYANPASAGLTGRPGPRARGDAGGRPSRGAAGPRPRCGPEPLRGRGRRSNLRAPAGRRPGVRLRQRLRHRRDGGEGTGAARPRERASPAQHPAGADRPAPARRGAAHRRPLRRRHAAVRRRGRVHPPVVHALPVRARRASSTRCSRRSTSWSIATTSRR